MNHEVLSKTTSQLTQLKFQNVEQLNGICGEASQAFSNYSTAKREEHGALVTKLREPICDMLRMVIAAQDACKRRKALISEKQKQLDEIEKLAKFLETQKN